MGVFNERAQVISNIMKVSMIILIFMIFNIVNMEGKYSNKDIEKIYEKEILSIEL